MFEYVPGTGYIPALTLGLAKGYWVYYQSNSSVIIQGLAPGRMTYNAKAGWNLIGSRLASVQLSSLILSAGTSIYGEIAYKYVSGSGYVSTTVILPMESVWVYMTADGTIMFPE